MLIESLPSQTASSMILFEGGSYTVGSEEGSEAERPVRKIDIAAFYLDESLVTNEQFSAFVEQTGYRTQAEINGLAWGWRDGVFETIDGLSWRSYAVADRAAHPVVLVTWHDANAYAQWAGKRLPTEWEWEVAASGGSAHRYPWGDHDPSSAECSWRGVAGQYPATAAVRSFPANGAGLFDMVGNVWQWCGNAYDQGAAPALAELKARRGGAWNVIQDFRLRCANRGALLVDKSAPNLGFRCAVDA